MPIYEYECTECGHRLEAIQKVAEAPLADCPSCGKARLRRLISAAGFHLKGSGWYVTDFKNSGKKQGSEKDGSKEAKSEKDGGGAKSEKDGGGKATSEKDGKKESKSDKGGSGSGGAAPEKKAQSSGGGGSAH